MKRDPEAFRAWTLQVRDWQPAPFDKSAYPRSALSTAKAVALMFGFHTDFGEQRCAVSDGKIGEELGLERRTIARYRQLLLDHGVLRDAGSYRRAMKVETGSLFHEPYPGALTRRRAEIHAREQKNALDPWAATETAAA